MVPTALKTIATGYVRDICSRQATNSRNEILCCQVAAVFGIDGPEISCFVIGAGCNTGREADVFLKIEFVSNKVQIAANFSMAWKTLNKQSSTLLLPSN